MRAVGIEDRSRVESIRRTGRRTRRERISSQSIPKISAALRRQRNRRRKGRAFAQARALVVAKNEGLVLLDGSTEKGPELVTLERLLALIEVVHRIEFVVANEFVDAAMDLVRARFQHHVDCCASAAELGAHGVFFRLELLDGVREAEEQQLRPDRIRCCPRH